MTENADKAKGTIKEKVGQVTDDKDLEREGKLDKAGADVKEKVGDAVDTVKDKVKDVFDRDNDKSA
jgi:uncharacterized protein YjbJ (UPF0337 family)